jgi:hypothetical protein
MREEAGDWPQDTSCGRLAFTDRDLPCASSQSPLVWASQAGSTSRVVCMGPFQFMSYPLGATRMVRSFSAHQSTRNSCRRLAFNDDQQHPCEVFAWGTGLVAPNIGSRISGPGPECFPWHQQRSSNTYRFQVSARTISSPKAPAKREGLAILIRSALIWISELSEGSWHVRIAIVLAPSPARPCCRRRRQSARRRPCRSRRRRAGPALRRSRSKIR